MEGKEAMTKDEEKLMMHVIKAMTKDSTRDEPLSLSQFIKNSLRLVDNDPRRAEVFVLARLLLDADHDLLAWIVKSEVMAAIDEANHARERPGNREEQMPMREILQNVVEMANDFKCRT
jgi:hypothetical protein